MYNNYKITIHIENSYEDKMSKEKLTIPDQIEDMKCKGIKFNIIDEKYAAIFLENNNYYFKLKSYAKNYVKYGSGKNKGEYINLEFAYLQELSTLDMHLRKIILKMTLDIEHFLKTQMLYDCSCNDKEDGYDIIRKFLDNNHLIRAKISGNKEKSACFDLIQKHIIKKKEYSLWSIVEVLSFGDFILLYEFYYSQYPSNNEFTRYLWSIKFLRNAAAHNNCLLNSLKSPYNIEISKNKAIMLFVSAIKGISENVRVEKMKNPVIHDFVVMLYVYNTLIKSEGVKKHGMKELKEFINERVVARKRYFEKNDMLKGYYEFIYKIVNSF
jgi:abortive infection bacteriophage resistance protein